MNEINHFHLFRWFLYLCLAALLSACGGGERITTVGGNTSGSTAAQTAPALAVAPQSNFNNNGNVDTAKFNAVQQNYQENLKVSK